MDAWTRFWAWCEGAIIKHRNKRRNASSTASRVQKREGEDESFSTCFSPESPEHLIVKPPISERNDI